MIRQPYSSGPNEVSESTATTLDGILMGDGAHVTTAAPNEDYLPATNPTVSGSLTVKNDGSITMMASDYGYSDCTITMNGGKINMGSYGGYNGGSLNMDGGMINMGSYSGKSGRINMCGGMINMGDGIDDGGTIDMYGGCIQNLAEPSDDNDAATKSYVDRAIQKALSGLGLSQ